MTRRLLWMLSSLVLCPIVVLAASDTYQNDGIVISPPDIAPTVDATNFINTGVFEINDFFYKTSHTLNYTNVGTLTAFIGFDFEYFPGGSWSANFFNPGEINCGSGSPAILKISATNILIPGNINIASDSLIALNANHVDLDESVITMFPGGTLTGGGSASSLDYGTGTSPVTNIYTWSPANNLTANASSSSVFTNITGGQLQMALGNSTPYVLSNQTETNYAITRAVFLQNNNPDLGSRVFIQQDGADGGGYGRVEWRATYVDTATGEQRTNYLYLTDIFTTILNSSVNNGIPSGFSFAQNNGAPLFGDAPIGAGLPPGTFIPGNVTNDYSFVSVDIIPTTVGTNQIIGFNVTNLPGRVQISSTKALALGSAQISGPNYLALNSTNQFDGNNGSSISAGFADFRLGVTNGILTISNLWKPKLPLWSGTIDAWNTRWFSVVSNVETTFSTNMNFTFITNADLTITTNIDITLATNTVVTSVTNDYRVLLVSSSLIPRASTYVQDLMLHATNSLVISDVFNVYRGLSIDAEKLTLTTNIFGTGADSPEGELNILPANLTWAGAVPRLRWLTNEGAIRILGEGSPSQNFGSSLPGSNYLAFVNRGLVVTPGSTIWADSFENSGIISNTAGSLSLHSVTAMATNGSIVAAGDITLISGSLTSSNLSLRPSRTLTLTVTNLLTDNDVTNRNNWTVGSKTGTGGNGLIMTAKPASGDLRGTTITVLAPPPNKTVANIWAGEDRRLSNSGFTNNAAIGKLILDSSASSKFSFSGLPGMTNALYVDYLELRNYATNRDVNGNFIGLNLADNIVIYYAQAVVSGASIAEKMDGKNNGHLRWVSSYSGKFSSKNVVIDGKTNAVNSALAQSTIIDSDGDGIPNASDTTPFFSTGQMNLTVALTNLPALTARVNWLTVPNATNFVEFKTNLLSAGWIPLTNFISPNPYPGPATNATVFDPLDSGGMRFYRVLVNPWVTYPY